MTNDRNEFGNMTCIAALLLSIPAIAPAQPVAIGAYPVPARGSQPVSITAGSDGALWFAQEPANSDSPGGIGRMTPAGVFKIYDLPYPENFIGTIVAGPDGALWFTEFTANQIGRITTAGRTKAYAAPTAGSEPLGLTVGSDGALWFTESNANQIGRITTAGHVTEYPIPTADSQPNGITAGPDGALWFTEFNANQIGRITKAGHVTEYSIPTAGSQPIGITAGPDGALWFTEFNGNQVGRITTTGAVTEYPVPTPVSELGSITPGPEGKLWFVGLNTNELGSITTDGVITEYPIPTLFSAEADAITTGPDGSLWLAEGGSTNAIGQAVFETASLSVTPDRGTYQTKLHFSGSGFVPGETVEIYTSGIGSAVLASCTADGGGSITAEGSWPASAYGPRLFLGEGGTSGFIGAASFSTKSKLVLTPNSGPVGTTVTVDGYGFGSYDLVTLLWGNPDTLLKRVTVGVNGGFSGFTFQVPAGSPAGSDSVKGGGVSAAFTVQ